MANRLAGSSSPYLRQHADNPVDWHEWGDEAFEEARRRDVPIFLSVGYSSCHWCHVMAHESFEDAETAAAMNADFVNIKVDREQRPDVDAVYMSAVQAMTRHGGWPMSVFLSADGTPFYGGTYWPATARPGMPSFRQVLAAVAGSWANERDKVLEQGSLVVQHLTQQQTLPDAAEVDASVLDTAADEMWLVPHFEKMLYDNALLLRAYVHGWQITGQPRFRRMVTDIAEYLLADLQQPEGGFSSATDADSEGVEGKYFVWTAEEFDEAIVAVGEDVAKWRERFGVVAEGNWHDPHGHAPPRANVLHEVVRFEEDDPGFARRWAAVRQSLAERRSLRVPPGLDDKVLVSWNALAIAALAEAGAVMDEPRWVEAARRAVDFVEQTMVVDGVLHHTWSPGHEASVPALLEDLALLSRALLVLYEADPDPHLVGWARELATRVEAEFADGEGAYYATAAAPTADGPELVVRPLDLWDNAQPAGSSVMVEVNARLAALDGDLDARDRAVATVSRFGGQLPLAPLGYGELATAAERLLSGPLEVAIVGEDAEPLLAVVRDTWRPGVVVAAGSGTDDGGVPLLRDRPTLDGNATAYVCRGFVCERPTTDPDELARQLSAAVAAQRSG